MSWSSELREHLAVVRRGGSDVGADEAHRPREAAGPRPDRPAARPGQPVPRAEPAGCVRDVRRGRLRRAERQHRDRDRPGQRPRVRGRRQRRDRQGRHLLPDDGQEAPARADDRGREPAALPLPRRLRRRVPADAGRGLPRPRALRPDLLQPGQPLGAGHPPDRQRDGLVHRRRRLRAGDERRVRDREEPGHDLPRRAAAGEGRDRRGRHRRGARRRRGARARLRRRRPPRRRRRARARDRAAIVDTLPGSGRPAAARPTERTRSRSRTSRPRACTTWCPATPARRTTCAR